MKDRKTIWIVAGSIITMILVIVLGVLTGKLNDARRRNALVEDAAVVLEELGEKGFFDLIGIPTDDLEWKKTPLIQERIGVPGHILRTRESTLQYMRSVHHQLCRSYLDLRSHPMHRAPV